MTARSRSGPRTSRLQEAGACLPADPAHHLKFLVPSVGNVGTGGAPAGGPPVVPFGGEGPRRGGDRSHGPLRPRRARGGFDPAAGYRTFEQQIERLDDVTALFAIRSRPATPCPRSRTRGEVAVRAGCAGDGVELARGDPCSPAATRARTSSGSPPDGPLPRPREVEVREGQVLAALAPHRHTPTRTRPAGSARRRPGCLPVL